METFFAFLSNFVFFLFLIVAGIVALAGLLWSVGVVRVLTLQEGSAVSMKWLGRHIYSGMEFENRHFNGPKIVLGPGPNWHGTSRFIWRIGGWLFYIWPLVKPNEYGLTNDPDDGFGFGNFVDLRDIARTVTVQQGETKTGLAVTVLFEITFRVVDPWAFQYVSPRDVIKKVNDRIEAVLARWMATVTDKDIQSFAGDGEAFWKKLEAEGLTNVFKEIEDKWGLQVVPCSVIVKRVDYDPDFQEAKKANEQAELRANAEVSRLSVPERMMAEWIASQAKAAGATTAEQIKKLVKLLKKSGEYQRKEAEFEERFKLTQPGYSVARTQNSYEVKGGDLASIAAVAGLLGLGGRGQQNRQGNQPPTQNNT